MASKIKGLGKYILSQYKKYKKCNNSCEAREIRIPKIQVCYVETTKGCTERAIVLSMAHLNERYKDKTWTLKYKVTPNIDQIIRMAESGSLNHIPYDNT